jgi:hypothetical protein
VISDNPKNSTNAPNPQVGTTPETTTDCLEAALDHLAKLRGLLEAAAALTPSATNSRRLRALSCGLLVFQSPLTLIDSDEARL